jgi:4-amino-4-deoxy-L-arabinose transferase-like glycosyltransferase
MGRFDNSLLDKCQEIGEQSTISKVRPDTIVILGLVSIGALLFVLPLAHHRIRLWDEAIYGNAARHMIQRGDWIVPHLYIHPQRFESVHYQPFLEKPPLVFWIQALSMKLLGISRFALRLPGAVFAILTGVVVYRFGADLYDKRGGFVAAVVFYTVPIVLTGNHGGRTGNTDVPMLFFGTAFLYLSWLSFVRGRKALLVVTGPMLALAFLAKGFNAAVFLIAAIPLILYNYRLVFARESARSVGLGLAFVLPWSLYAWYKHGADFVNQLFFQQVLARATGQKFVSSPDTTFEFMRFPYFEHFPKMIDPWFSLLLPAVFVGIIAGYRARETIKPLFLTWWVGSVFVLFTVTGNHGWYLMPVVVPSALLIAGLLYHVSRRDPIALAGTAAGLSLMAFERGFTSQTQVVLLGISAIVIIDPLQRRLRSMSGLRISPGLKTVGGIAIGALVVLSLIGTVPVNTPRQDLGAGGQLGETANRAVPDNETVALGMRTRKPFVFSFYARRPLTREDSRTLTEKTDIRYALLHKRTLADIDREATVLESRRNLRLIEFDGRIYG